MLFLIVICLLLAGVALVIRAARHAEADVNRVIAEGMAELERARATAGIL